MLLEASCQLTGQVGKELKGLARFMAEAEFWRAIEKTVTKGQFAVRREVTWLRSVLADVGCTA